MLGTSERMKDSVSECRALFSEFRALSNEYRAPLSESMGPLSELRALFARSYM